MNKFLTGIYDHSPAFVQNLAVSLYGLKIYRREYGRKFERILSEFEKLQWLSYVELETYQEEMLQQLIRHAFDNVPYYREIMQAKKLTPDDFKSVSDLCTLPVLTPDDIRNNFERLIASNHRKDSLIHGHTSGTTGSPLQFLYDNRVCLYKNVVDWRQKKWAGINPGDTMAFFLGRMVVPAERKRPPFWRQNWVLNHTFFSGFHMSSDNLSCYLDQLAKLRPRAIEGYPSTLSILAGYLNSRGLTFPFKAAFTSSETLYPQQREAIEKAFECKLFDFYGLAERVAFATECDAHEGHHLNMDFGITEIINKNGEPADKGELGRIVATGLHNYGMPLIRYQTSDVTSIKDGDCSCGRRFPMMEDVTTKAEDIVTTLDGRYVASSILTHPFKPLLTVTESQIIQEDRSLIRIKIVPRENYSQTDSDYIVTEMQKRVGEDMKIEIELVESIPRTASGKFRWVISKVPLEF